MAILKRLIPALLFGVVFSSLISILALVMATVMSVRSRTLVTDWGPMDLDVGRMGQIKEDR
jgi:hypothetical protein